MPILSLQHLRQRRQAVGRARGVGDDRVRALEHVVVHAVDDRGVHVLAARGRDHDLLRAAGEMLARIRLGGEEAGGLEHVFGADRGPVDLRRIALREHLDLVAVDDDRIAFDAHRARELAVRGVVLREVRVGLRIAEVVDRDDLDFVGALGFVERAQDVAADTSVTVDTYFDGHLLAIPLR